MPTEFNYGQTSCTSTTGRSLFLLAIMGPFACAYFLSYLLRNVNAIVAPDLVSAFHFEASDLGLLTGIYFFTFGLSQPFLGILLDKFGPRRVQGVLLMIAASGALFFAWSASAAMLIAGRGLIGLGVCGCLMAAIQANALWFPAERLAKLNGFILSTGGIGAIFSTTPIEWMLHRMDWRMLFILFAAAFAAVSLLIFSFIPEHRPERTQGARTNHLKGFIQIGKSREFWRIAPLTMMSQAAFMSVQGLWAARWMKDVASFPRDEIANYLLLAAIGMAVGHAVMGNLASRLQRAGISPSYLVGLGVGLGIAVQGFLALGCISWQETIWILFGFFGTAGTVNFTILAQSVPVSMVGRASTSLNTLVFASTFVIQWGMGAIINCYPTERGGYLPSGYAVAFGATLVLQVATLFWFIYRLKHVRE